MKGQSISIIKDNSFSISKKDGIQSKGLISWFALAGVLIVIVILGREYLRLKFGVVKNKVINVKNNIKRKHTERKERKKLKRKR